MVEIIEDFPLQGFLSFAPINLKLILVDRYGLYEQVVKRHRAAIIKTIGAPTYTVQMDGISWGVMRSDFGGGEMSLECAKIVNEHNAKGFSKLTLILHELWPSKGHPTR